MVPLGTFWTLYSATSVLLICVPQSILVSFSAGVGTNACQTLSAPKPAGAIAHARQNKKE